jgi:hypothetical protein
VCRNNYMLFRKDNAMLEECHFCGSSRYKGIIKNIDRDDMWENKKDKRLPYTVAWYFTIVKNIDTYDMGA